MQENAKFLWEKQYFFAREHKCSVSKCKVSWGNNTFARKGKCFWSERKFSWGNTILLQANAKFLWRMKYFCKKRQMFYKQTQLNTLARKDNWSVSNCKIDWGNATLLQEKTCFESECNISWGNATLLQEKTNVLQANAKFLRGMQYFCEGIQRF